MAERWKQMGYKEKKPFMDEYKKVSSTYEPELATWETSVLATYGTAENPKTELVLSLIRKSTLAKARSQAKKEERLKEKAKIELKKKLKNDKKKGETSTKKTEKKAKAVGKTGKEA